MDSQDSKKKSCPRCGRVKTEGGGSITQWISACNCADSDAPLDALPPSTICATCGKRQEAGRSGSFTQWVFRQDLCTCNQPGYALSSFQTNQTAPNELSEESYADEEELEVNSDKFPIERYKPLAELGRGASGTVYLCRDRLLGTKVAVKVLTVLTSEKLVSFQNEARATSRLSHKNIVKILDFGATESGYPYMVMERFVGESLEKFLEERGTLSPFLAIMIFTEVADGLEYAHERGVFHRDIKPSNLLLNFDEKGYPSVLIIDFGVAQLQAGLQEPTIIQGRTMVGSPKYMSPDQANNLTYDQRSEIYSVGCVLFEALAGRAPFDGETPLEIIGKHANELPPKLSEIVGENVFPKILEVTVERTLAKDPNERVQSMADLKKELSRAQQQDTRTGLFTQADRGAPLKRVLQVASSIALVVLVLLGINTWQMQVPHKTKKETKITKGFRSDKKDPRRGSMDVASYQPNSEHWNIDEGIWVGDTFIKDSDLETLRGKNVEQLLLRDSSVTNKGVSALGDMKLPLVLLDLTNSKVDDGVAPYMVKFTSLTHLYLSRTKISDKGIDAMKGMPGLTRLELDDCPITDHAVDVIANRWPNIGNIDISSTKVTTKSFERITKLKNLHHLMVANLRLSNRDMDLITSLPLRTADFTESDFGSLENMKKVTRFKELETLELSLAKPKIDVALARWLQQQLPRCNVRIHAQLENDMDTSSDMQPPIEFLGE